MPLASENEREIPGFNEAFAGGSYAYFIGISHYINTGIPQLASPANDVDILQAVLKEKHGFKVTSVSLPPENGGAKELPNPLLDATRQDLLDFVKNIRCEEDSRLIVYFACHGVAESVSDGGNPEGFLLPSDAQLSVHSSYVSMSEIHAALSALPCRHLLIILDCCYAGAFKWIEVKRSLGAEKPLNLYYQKYRQYVTNKTRQVITSAAADQQASDYSNRDSGRRNSPFARCLANALESDKADYLSPGQKRGDGIITVTELGLYLRSNIEDTKQIPAVWNIGADTKGEFIFLNPEQQRRTLILLDKDRPNPYKGLLAYTTEDRNIFFGRQRALETWSENNIVHKGLFDAVKENNLVLVTGRSGSGKSSLVKAGILSAYDSSLIRQIRPGTKPLTENAAVLAELLNEKTNRYCLLADQFEELITHCKDEGERNDFQQQLKKIAAHHTVILTLRSDFEIQFKASPLIGEGCAFYRFAVPPFTREDMYDIVVGPANHQAMEYKALPVRKGGDPNAADNAFINRIVNDSFTYLDSLPLLSLALSKLYEEKESDAQDNAEYLTEKTYNRFKGITGIIEEGAESIFRKYDGNGKAVATETREEMTADQQLLTGLIFRMMSFEGGEITKRRVYTNRNERNGQAYNELQFSDAATTEQCNRIKEDLVAARLLKADKDEAGNEYTEPAHEALLRSWPRLTYLLDKSDATGSTRREKIILLKQVSELARQYHLATRKDKKDILWVKDYRLQQVLQYKGNDFRLNVVEEAFISASEKERRRSKRIRNTWYTAGLTASLIAAIVFLYQYINIQKKNHEVQNQLAKSYWDEALNAGGQYKNNEALLYMAEALNKAADKDLKEQMLISAGNKMPAIVLQNIIELGEKTNRYQLSSDGNTILVFSDSLLRLYDVASGKQKYASVMRRCSKALFGSDDATIFAISERTAYIMDSSLHILDSVRSESNFTGIDAAAGNHTFVTGTDTGTISLLQYRTEGVQLLKSFASDFPASHFITSPDGQRLFAEVSPEDAGMYGIYKCELWDVVTGKMLYAFRTESPNITLAVNPALTKIFTSAADGSSQFFELGKGKKTIRNASGAGFDAAVFVNGNDSLLLSTYDTLSYWNFGKAEREGDSYRVPVELQSDVVYCRAADYLLIGNTLTGRYYLLDAHTLQTNGELVNPDGIYPKVSADGSIITLQTNTAVYIYRYQPPAEQDLGNKTFDLFTFSPDGKFAATIDSKNDCEIWDLKDGSSLFKQPHRFAFEGDKNVWRDKLFFSGGTVVLQSGSKAVLYDFKSGIEKTLDSASFYFNPVSADGKKIVYALPDGTAHLREAPGWNDQRAGITSNNVQQCYFMGSPQQIVVVKKDNKACLKKLGEPGEKLLYNGGKEPLNITLGAPGNWCLLYQSDGKGVLCSSNAEGNHIMAVADLHFGKTNANTTDNDDSSTEYNAASVNNDLNFFISANGKFLLQKLNDSFFVYHVETGARDLVKAVSFLDAADIANAAIDETGQLLLLPYDESINPQMTTTVIDLASRRQKGPAFSAPSKDKKNSVSRVFHFNHSGQFVLQDVSTALNDGSFGHTWHLYDYNKARTFASLPCRYDSAFFLKDESIICGYSYDDNNKIHIRTTGFDLDISPSLFAKQTAVLTGERLNTTTGEMENIPPAEWRNIKQQYQAEAAEHNRQCRYKQFNTWARLYSKAVH